MHPGSSTGECYSTVVARYVRKKYWGTCSQKSRKVVLFCLTSRMMLQLVPRDGLAQTWLPKMK